MWNLTPQQIAVAQAQKKTLDSAPPGAKYHFNGAVYDDLASAEAAQAVLGGYAGYAPQAITTSRGGGGGGGGGGDGWSDRAATGGGLASNPVAAPPPGPNRFEAGLADTEGRLKNLLDNPDSINQSAAYKFRVSQGQEALQRSMGARGMLNSGNRLSELMKYGQDMGSQEYDNQFGRLSDLYKINSNSYIGQGTNLNDTQDISNKFQLGSVANANDAQDISNRFKLGNDQNVLGRDKFNYEVKQDKVLENERRVSSGQLRVGESGISNPWALPGYNGIRAPRY